MENKDFSKLPFLLFYKLGADLFVFAVIFAHRKQLAYAKSSIFHIGSIENNKVFAVYAGMYFSLYRAERGHKSMFGTDVIR